MNCDQKYSMQNTKYNNGLSQVYAWNFEYISEIEISLCLTLKTSNCDHSTENIFSLSRMISFTLVSVSIMKVYPKVSGLSR